MAAKLCRKGTPLTSGRPRSWASGIVHALGWVNFLSDPSQDPHMSVRPGLVPGGPVAAGVRLLPPFALYSMVLRSEYLSGPGAVGRLGSP